MPDADALHPHVAAIAALARRPVALDPAGRARVMELVRRSSTAEFPLPIGQRPRGLARVFEPRLRLSPIVSAALAAGLVGIGVLAGMVAGRRGVEPAAAGIAAAGSAESTFDGATPVSNRTPAGIPRGVVKFVLVAPHATQVAVVGDFNRWNPAATPMERTPTGGTWTVELPLSAGRHLYSFIVNGNEWVADPGAPLAPEDGFGAPNSVVLVGGTS
jgi:hypothetical protein